MEAFSQFHPPTALRLDSSNLEEEWRFWEQKFDLFLMATSATEKSETTQIAMFLHAIGDDALKVFNTFALTADERKKLSVIKQKFKDYCTPRKNVIYERYLFGKLTQAAGESIDAFVTTLRLRAKSCAFGDQEESLIRDRVVIGCSDFRVQERLLREPDLSLEKALTICRAAEATKEQIKSLRGDVPLKPSVDSVKSKIDCRNCGHQHPPRSCPAFGKQCHKCGKNNHFSKVCRQSSEGVSQKSSKKPVKYRRRTPSSSRTSASAATSSSEVGLNAIEDDSLFLGAVQSDLQSNKKCWLKSFFVNGTVVSCKLDSGAEANVMPKTVYESLRYRPQLRHTEVTLCAYGGSPLRPLGVVTVNLHHKRRSYKTEFYVVNSSVQTLLGLPSCQQLDVVRRVDAVDNSLSSKSSIIDEFADVFTGIGCMPRPHHIVIDPSVQPVVHPPRRVPISLQPKLKKTLDNLVQAGIIVKRDEPTDWVSSLLILEKKDGSLRLCLDPKHLNVAIKREHFKILTIDDVAPSLYGKRLFSIIDIKDAFWNVQLDEESSKHCTFNTMFGRYSFTRLVFGCTSSPEVFQKRMSELFGDIEGVHVVFDDLIIAAVDDNDHDRILRVLLERARKYNVRFNRNKLQFKVPQVKYLGHLISQNGIKADPYKVKAIVDMPSPTDEKGLQRFLGLIAFLAKFIPNCSSLTEPLRQLNKADVVWDWSDSQQQSFERLKQAVSTAPVLRFYDPSKPCTIQTDSSLTGIGSVCMQDDQPIAFASRALIESETRWAQIERELMAILFACEKFNIFIYGHETVIQSDHKPLEAIFKKPISSTTPRLQRMLLRLMKYQLRVQYTPGSKLFIADTLSRAYLPASDADNDKEISDDVNVMIHTLLYEFPASNKRLQEFRIETERDTNLSQLKTLLVNGFSQQNSSLTYELNQLKKIASDIYEMDGIYFVHGKVIVPSSMRQEMLSIVHQGHLGIDKCKSLARQCMYWPGLSRDVEMTVSKCAICNAYRRQQTAEPLMPHKIPQGPWQKVAADLFSYARRDYLLVVDYYSKYPEIALLEDKTANSVITHLKSIFARHGVPIELIADNMPFASKAMREFADNWNFTITTSSPTYPQSNGQSERFVQSIKRLLKKASDDKSDPYVGLMQYRNAQIAGLDVSPAQLLFSRRLRTKLPSSSASLQPEVMPRHKALLDRQAKQKQYFDTNTRPLSTLRPGDVVRVRHDEEWRRGRVVLTHDTPRSYIVETEDGSTLRRNRRHLVKSREDPPLCVPPLDYSDAPSATSSSDSSAFALPSRTVSLTSSATPPSNSGTITTASAPATTRCGRIVKPPVRFKDFV
jgi:hypothetical protein